VYGSPLRLPGEFCAPSPADCTDVTDFASRLRVHIGKLRPVPASRHAAPSTFILKDLATASRVFLRYVGLRGVLQAPYVDPYRVHHMGDKTYTIDIEGSTRTVSIDHLKPAYVLRVHSDTASPPAVPSGITTRSGRRVRFPDYLGCSGLSGGWCGECHRLAHPPSQYIASSTPRVFINRELLSRSVDSGRLCDASQARAA
jgi:hypothetical protein